MDFFIGPSQESKEKFLERNGVLAPYHLKLDWQSIPEGFLPVVLIKNVVTPLAVIAHCEEKLEELTQISDERPRTIYLVRIEKLLPVAGVDFIEYVRTNGLADEEAISKALEQEEETQLSAEDMLFAGDPMPMGGLSNEDALVRACPEEFRRGNPWCDYTSKLFFHGADISNWQFKSSDREEKKRQMSCLRGLLETFGIGHNQKEAVAGWMLSRMLSEVPEHIAVKQG